MTDYKPKKLNTPGSRVRRKENAAPPAAICMILYHTQNRIKYKHQ